MRLPQRTPRVRGWILVLVLGTWGVLPILAVPLAPAAATNATGVGCTPGSGLSLNATPSAGPAPLKVLFAISDPHGPPSTVNWTFGDGTPPAVGEGDPYLSTNHLYSTWGLFEAVVNISQGAQSLLCFAAVEVTPPGLSVTIAATPRFGSAPLTVQFTVDVTGGTSDITEASWTFGDGSTATGFNLSYTYTAPGNYTAALSVIDSANQSADEQVEIEVNASTDRGPAPGPDAVAGVPTWELALAAGAALLLAIGLLAWWRWGVSDRSGDALSPSSAARFGASEARPPPASGTPETIPSTDTSPADVEEAPRSAHGSGAAPGDVGTLVVPTAENSDVGPEAVELFPPPAASPGAPLSPSASEAPRLKLSQRVMLHLYLQGHLAEGEVAPFGFTQGGMAEKLQVAQSPLSSVLRRLVVAGLVTQDTRHVRGQPRRLRVYRLTPVGEVVARDLYRNHVDETASPSRGE
jgi:PKD repeat protein